MKEVPHVIGIDLGACSKFMRLTLAAAWSPVGGSGATR